MIIWPISIIIPKFYRIVGLSFFFKKNLWASFVSLWPGVGWWRQALCSYGTGVCVSWKGEHYPVFFRLTRTGTANVLFNHWLFINIESLSYYNCINQCTNLVAALYVLQMFFIFVTLAMFSLRRLSLLLQCWLQISLKLSCWLGWSNHIWLLFNLLRKSCSIFVLIYIFASQL